MSSRKHLEERRNFLRFIAASPLFSGLAASSSALISALAPSIVQAQGSRRWELDMLSRSAELIESAGAALNVFDFEPVLQSKLNPGHYAYMAQSADDGTILRVNREGFDQYQLLPRRLVDVSQVDLSVELFGETYDQPIFFAPSGHQTMYHPDGELAVARVARNRNTLMALSTVTNQTIEDVAETRNAPIWFQLYPTNDWDVTRGMIRRAERAGCNALALTVDSPARNLELASRFNRDTDPFCQTCHTPGPNWQLKSMFDGIDMSQIRMGIGGLTWNYVERLKESTSMNVLVKGITTAEDAENCITHGADGMIVSNHGGRASSSNRSTIEALPEIVAAVAGRVPVIIDSGFRRGTDIYKALALGADAVCIGRPYLWGLGAFGEAGVERVLDLLIRELNIVMQQMGATSLGDIRANSVRRIAI